jgi:hypothetical protein
MSYDNNSYDQNPSQYNGTVLSEIEKSNRAQMKLMEFRERLDRIEKLTGERPLSFFEYDKKHPTTETTMKNAPLGFGFIGAFVGALFVGSSSKSIFSPEGKILEAKTDYTPIFIGAVIGMIVGLFTKETRADTINRALDNYENYLVSEEKKANTTKIVDKKERTTSTKTHAEKVSASRAVAENIGISA